MERPRVTIESAEDRTIESTQLSDEEVERAIVAMKCSGAACGRRIV